MYERKYWQGRPNEYCEKCRPIAKREFARDRKRAERQRKATEQGKPEPRLLEGGESGSERGGRGLSPLSSTMEIKLPTVREMQERFYNQMRDRYGYNWRPLFTY